MQGGHGGIWLDENAGGTFRGNVVEDSGTNAYRSELPLTLSLSLALCPSLALSLALSLSLSLSPSLSLSHSLSLIHTHIHTNEVTDTKRNSPDGRCGTTSANEWRLAERNANTAPAALAEVRCRVNSGDTAPCRMAGVTLHGVCCHVSPDTQ